MEEIKLKKWNEFRNVVDDIRNKYGYHEIVLENNKTYREKNVVLFRGQQNAGWQLETTLERKTKRTFSVGQYLSRATRLVHELEAYTNKKWNIPDMPLIDQEIEEKQDSLFGPYVPHYDYLIYLRHHGYPSPLLDWSESPYIAAYFAMLEPLQEGDVAIFVYVESTNSGKEFFAGNAIIKLFGPFVSTDKRHFMQQAWYTTATKWSEGWSQHIFCSHHEVFDQSDLGNTQDILIKITIPASERKTALKDLYEHNINHFTLFQTEDSLVKALSMKYFDLGET